MKISKYILLGFAGLLISGVLAVVVTFISRSCEEVKIKSYITPGTTLVVNQYVFFCNGDTPDTTVIKVDNGERETQQVFIDNKAYTNTDFIETRYGNYYNPSILYITVYLEAKDRTHVYAASVNDEEEGINISFTTREEENRIKLLNEE